MTYQRDGFYFAMVVKLKVFSPKPITPTLLAIYGTH